MKNLITSFLFVLCSVVVASAQFARVQVVHNAPDPTVDVYVNGGLALDDFAFRAATGFLNLPAGIPLTIAIAPASSTSAGDALLTTTETFENGKTYVLTASGIPFNASTPLGIVADGNAREASVGGAMMVDLSILHGAPDAPAVDIAVRTGSTIAANLSYGQFTPYLSVPAAEYFIDVKLAGTQTIVQTYRADLTGDGGKALKIMASGLLSGTPQAFGLYAVFADGTVEALPAAPVARVQFIHNSPDPAAALVDIYKNGGKFGDDVAFRMAKPFEFVPAGSVMNIGLAPASSASVSDTIKNFPFTFENGKTYIVTAIGLLNDLATPLSLSIKDDAQERTVPNTLVGVSVAHGSPGAPSVDVDAVFVANDLVNTLAYPQSTPYYILEPDVYDLAVRAADNPSVLASYRASLSGLGGQALHVFASGILGGTPAFGLFAALPDGQVLQLSATPTARIQIVHNAPQPVVDVYTGIDRLLTDFAFRTATPFVTVPADRTFNVGVALAGSSSSGQAIANFPVNFDAGKSYTVFASGLVGGSPGFTLIANEARETGANPGNVDVAVFHGSPDAPAVDVDAVFLADNVIEDLAYGESTGYLGLPAGVYDLAVRAANDPNVVATFRANLSTLGGGAAYVFASGLLAGTPGFGLFAALPNGTVIALPLTPTARVQIIHNAPSLTVDVYAGNTRLLDDFAFRTATPFVTVPADRSFTVGVALANSGSVADVIAPFPVSFEAGKSYAVFASGLVGGSPGFTLIANEARETGANPGNVDVAVFHGSPDAPAVDVDAVFLADNVIEDLAYGESTGYLGLPAGVYDLAVRAANDPNVVASFRADLSTLGGGAAYVFASGLLAGTPGFGLFAALPNGTVIALPLTPTARVQIIHNAPSPTVDVYAGNTRLLDDFAFRTATPFVTVPADRSFNVGVALANSGSVADVIAPFPVSFEAGKSYAVFASGLVGGSPGFTLIANEARETGANPGNVDVAVFHGSPDAPAVDVDAVFLADNVIEDLAYGESTGYLGLPAGVYDLAIRAANDPNVVATFRANLSTLGGGAAYVFASGLLAGTPGFGLFAALPNGTVIALPLTPTARVQIIHNAPSPTVDVYAGNTRLLDDFAFRTATPFVTVPADRTFTVGVALANSGSVADVIAPFPVNFDAGETYTVMAAGIVGGNPGFDLFVNADAQESAEVPTNVDINLFHGAPNAPEVDVKLLAGPVIFDDIQFGEFSNYLGVPANEYVVAVTPSNDNDNIVASYVANLTALAGGAATVFASGYLGGQTPEFGVWVALPNGTTFALPVFVRTNELEGKLEGLRLFPNPVSDELVVDFRLNETEALRYAIRDLTGRMVTEGDFGSVLAGAFNARLDVRSLSNGMYQLEILSDSGIKASKFVVQQ